MSNPPNGVLGIQRPRRSNRQAMPFPIWLRNEEMGPTWEEETETQIVSRHGAGLRCRHLVSSKSMVVIVRRDTGQRAKAQVRYSQFNLDGKREVGIEFIDDDNFWSLDWNSSEPTDSQPEKLRTPSGPAQVHVFSQMNDHARKRRVDLQLSQEEGFVFTEDGKPFGLPARTLEQFISSLTSSAPSVVEGHIHRGDFSQWVADVFHDPLLASEIRKLEQRYRQGHVKDLCNSLARLIAECSDFSDEL
jgi:hypothetical protein